MSAVYNEDGRRVLSASSDTTIREWDRETGECLNTIQPFYGMHIMGCSFKNAVFTSPTLETIVRQYGGILFRTHLEHVHIKKLAHLGDVDIRFPGDAKFTNKPYKHLVITGKNGSGKTVLLSAIDKCLSDFNKNPRIAKFSTTALELGFFGRDDVSFIKDFVECVQSGNMIYYYFPSKSRLSDSDIDELIGFLIGAYAQADKPTTQGGKGWEVIRYLKKGLKKLLHVDEISLEFANTKIYLCESGKTHPLECLPHGYQALIGLLGKLLTYVYEQEGEPETAKGLVLIDEPELHLHEALQKTFLPALMEIFPYIQFVVATQSQIILDSMGNPVVYDLGCCE